MLQLYLTEIEKVLQRLRVLHDGSLSERAKNTEN